MGMAFIQKYRILRPYIDTCWSTELLTAAQTDFASFSFWQSDIITVMAAISPLSFFFFPVKELWLLCWWVIHITEPDAQIPETSFYCCIKAERVERGWAVAEQLGENI